MAKPTKLKEMIAEPDTFAARFCECARDTWGDDASLREIAAALGVTAPTVGDWLRNRYTPPMDRCVMLACLFGVATEWLITGRGPRYVPPVDGEIAEIAYAIAHEIVRVPEALRPVFLHGIRNFASSGTKNDGASRNGWR